MSDKTCIICGARFQHEWRMRCADCTSKQDSANDPDEVDLPGPEVRSDLTRKRCYD
jgi:hypothetical protein